MFKGSICWASVLLALWTLTDHCQGQENVTAVIANIFKNGYDKRTRPHPTEADLTIDVSLSLARTVALSEEEMSWTAELYLYQRWKDERLSFQDTFPDVGDAVVGGNDIFSLSWDPKTYFPMARAEKVDRSDVYFRIASNGTVILVTRLFVTFPCTRMKRNQISLNDELECHIRLASFLYGGQHGSVRYSWANGDKSVATLPTKLDFLDHRFVAELVDKEGNSSSYPTLSARVQFRLRVGLLCRLLVLPALVAVTVACLAMYVPSKWSGVRLALSAFAVFFGTVLVMVSATKGTRTVDATSVDRFLYGCLMAVGLTMVDHLLVTYRAVMSRKARNKNLQESRDQRAVSGQPYRMVPKHTDHQRLLLQCTPQEPPDCRSRWRRCTTCMRESCAWILAISDWLLRLAVPSFFVVFVFHYQEALFHNTQFEPEPGPVHSEQEKSFGVPVNSWI